MKKSFFPVIGVALLLLSSACSKRSLLTYDTTNKVYFTSSAITFSDSTLVSFGYSLPEEKDSTLKISVSVTGSPADHDRNYILRSASTSTAVEGTHYAALKKTYFIPAGKVRDTISVILFRTDDIKSTARYLDLELFPNTDFITDMTVTGDAGSISYTKYRIAVIDTLSKPLKWPANYGRFSPKKLYLACELGGIKPVMFTDNALFNNNAAINARFLLLRYLQEMQTAGTPVLYEDGTPMKMND